MLDLPGRGQDFGYPTGGADWSVQGPMVLRPNNIPKFLRLVPAFHLLEIVRHQSISLTVLTQEDHHHVMIPDTLAGISEGGSCHCGSVQHNKGCGLCIPRTGVILWFMKFHNQLQLPGVTLTHTSVRRAPNVMNFLRQVEVLQMAGESTSFSAPCLQSVFVFFSAHVFLWAFLKKKDKGLEQCHSGVPGISHRSQGERGRFQSQRAGYARSLGFVQVSLRRQRDEVLHDAWSDF